MSDTDPLSKAELLKIKPSYIQIKIGYSLNIVVPHKAGICIIEALEGAEAINRDDSYGHPKIEILRPNAIEISLLSQKEYLEYKTNALLLPVKDELPNRASPSF